MGDEPHHESGDRLGHVGGDGPEVGRHAAGDCREHRHERCALERQPVGEQLVENDSQPEEIALRVERAALDPLRRHVGGCADDRPIDGHVEAIITPGAGQAEVDDPHLAVRLLQKDIVGLDVAVHEPLAVGSREPLRDFAADAEHLGERERALRLSGLLERAADEQLHHDVGQALFVADLVDRHHVGVIDRRRRPALAQKSTCRCGVAGLRRMKHLDGDVAAEFLVPGQIDAAHSAPADQLHDRVAADRRRERIVGCRSDGSRDRRLGAADDVGRVGQRRVGGVGLVSQAADHERAEWIAAVHARRLVDLDFLVVVRGDATHEPAGQRAELPLGAIDEMQLVQRGPHRLEHRRQGAGICRADHRVDDRFGVFDEIERLPPWVDVPARYLQEMRGEKVAELLERVGK